MRINRINTTILDDEIIEQGYKLTRIDSFLSNEIRDQGDPDARLRGPELIVVLELVDGLEREVLDAVLARLAQRWAPDDRIAVLADSLTVKLRRSA